MGEGNRLHSSGTLITYFDHRISGNSVPTHVTSQRRLR